MKPRIRFLNYVHRPCYFHPLQWCITEKCARFFWTPDSREGRLLMEKDKIWGWKEHSKIMQIYFGNVVLLDYKFRYLEMCKFEAYSICMHFSKHLELDSPKMPLFNFVDGQDHQDDQDTPF